MTADFEAYLDGFSPNVQDILDNFEFRNQIPRLSKADALGTLIEKLTSPDINLSPTPVLNTDGSVKHPGLDNHGMGSRMTPACPATTGLKSRMRLKSERRHSK